MGLLLNFVASILILCLQIICYVVGIVLSVNKKEFNQWQTDLAYAKDVFGNVLIKYIADIVLIKPNSGHKFGQRGQTISYVIGANKVYNTLTYCGNVLDGVLEFFDPGHSLSAFGQRNTSVQKKHWFNKMFWLYFFGITFISFGVLQNWFPVLEMFMWLSLGYPIGLLLVMIFFAFVINPINNFKNAS